jgi:hypothetical protein
LAVALVFLGACDTNSGGPVVATGPAAEASPPAAADAAAKGKKSHDIAPKPSVSLKNAAE